MGNAFFIGVNRRVTQLLPLEFSLLKLIRRLCTPVGGAGETRSQRACFIVQVSGGADSMCLLHAMARATRSSLCETGNNISIIAHHFNHAQRAQASDGDENLVIDTCLTMGLEIRTEHASQGLLPLLSCKKDNFQNAARTWRRDTSLALRTELLHSGKYAHVWVCTAHHARDNVETILQHILRGSGLAGLKGLNVQSGDGVWFRPFVRIAYEEIVAYCQARRVPFRVDESNHSDDYERNYLRHHVLPHLLHLQPAYQRTFGRLSENISEAFANLEKSEKSCQSEGMTLCQTTTPGELIRFAQAHNDIELRTAFTSHVAQNIITHYRRATRHPNGVAFGTMAHRGTLTLVLANGWSAQVSDGLLKFVK